MTVVVGVNAWSMQSTYMRSRPHREMYREMLREAQLAESLGFESFWLGEHHFAYDGYCPSMIVAAGRLLAGTTTLKVGSGIMLLPLHDGERVAEGVAALNSFAPGRFRLGVAGGWREVEYLGSGIALKDRPRLMDEYLGALVDGEYADRFGATEIYMGGGSPAAIRRAGRFGTGLILAYAGPKEAAERRELLEQNLRENPRTTPRIASIRDVWVARDPARLEWIRGRLAEMWRFYARFDDAKVKVHHVHGAEPSDNVDENVPSMMAFGTQGDPEQVYEELAAIVRTGIDELVIRVRFDGIDPELVEDQLRILADEVVPELRKIA
jgi:alkanesulfonate monooxygenase SsuD/methylene tetrahydromethanopterin reductase-like flavin-dependent oxidoreductase (luciferase family)